MRTKKRFGQHFLMDESVVQKIVEEISKSHRADALVEVGPGDGRLSELLFDLNEKYHAVEIDRDLFRLLREKYADRNWNLIEGDFLKLNLWDHVNEHAVSLVGNFPYNISSQIIFRMLEYRERIPLMIGMFQKEVADRLVADHGSKIYGAITVLTQAYYHAKYLFTVDRSAFRPPPKVTSAVIRLDRKPPEVYPEDPIHFKKLVKQAFSQRRKMLRNTLKGLIADKELLLSDQFLKRPEHWSVEDFVQMSNKTNMT